VFAAGALGVKKVVEVSLAKRRERKEQRQRPDEERARANRVLEKLSGEENDKRCQAIARRLKSDLEFFESGVIKADDLKASVDEAIKAYRDHFQSMEDSL
jgi:predicted phage gp36 major capsid-like protein